MRFLKFLFASIIIIGGIGYGVYYFGTNIASEKVMDVVTTELENSGQLEDIKDVVNNDPELRKFIEDGANADESNLPFTTKEQATRALIQKVGISELQSIQSRAQNGMSNDEVQALLKELEGKLY